MTDPLGNSTTFKYDGSGNLTEADLPNGTVTSYAYDASSDLNKISTTKSGTLQFSFDASGANGIGPDGNVQSMTTSQQSNVGLRPGNGTAGNAGTDTYNYDPLQRLTADSQTGPSGTTNSSSMTYADNGEITSASGPTIHNGSYTYQGTTGHDAGKLQSIGSGLAFAYDAQGNRTCQGTASPCSSNTTYTYGYDANNRLTSWADTANDSETWSYDGNGLLQQSIYKTPGSVCPSIPQGGSSATPWTPVPSISHRPLRTLLRATAPTRPTWSGTRPWAALPWPSPRSTPPVSTRGTRIT